MAKASSEAKGEDPIFEAISRHNERFRLFCALSDRHDVEGRAETKADKAATEAASNAETEAVEAPIATAPQTIAGLRGAIEHLAKYDDGSEPVASGRFLAALLKSPLLADGTREAAPMAWDHDRDEKERLAQLAKREHFDRLYARWLEARASLESHHDGDSDEIMNARQDALDEAARQFLIVPAFLDWMIWEKWEVLEFDLNKGRSGGKGRRQSNGRGARLYQSRPDAPWQYPSGARRLANEGVRRRTVWLTPGIATVP
jgi:hypothetical protein